MSSNRRDRCAEFDRNLNVACKDHIWDVTLTQKTSTLKIMTSVDTDLYSTVLISPGCLQRMSFPTRMLLMLSWVNFSNTVLSTLQLRHWRSQQSLATGDV